MPIRFIIAIAGVIALCASAFAQTSQGHIQGRLASARGPLPGVEVRIRNEATGEVTEVTTSRDGVYSAAVVPG